MIQILKLSIICLTIKYCTSTKSIGDYDGYYRYKPEDKNENFKPMTLEQIRDSPLISSMIEEKTDTKVAFVTESPLSEQKLLPLIEQKPLTYSDHKDFIISPPLETYLKEEPESSLKDYINSRNTYSHEKQETSSDQWKTTSGSVPSLDQKSYSNYAYPEEQELPTPQLKAYTNSMTNIEPNSYSRYSYTNPEVNQEKWTPIISNNYNSQRNSEQLTDGTIPLSNSGRNQESLSSQLNTYSNSYSSSEPNVEQKYNSNNGYTNSDYKRWNSVMRNKYNSDPNLEQQSYRNQFSDFNHYDSGARDMPSPHRKMVYQHQVPNFYQNNDDLNSQEHEENEENESPLTRLFNLGKNRLRSKKIVMERVVLS